MTETLTIGSIGISVILVIVLRMIYQTFNIPNTAKPWIAVFIGMGLAVAAMFTVGGYESFGQLATYLVQGFMTGATATGMYEMTKKHY